MNFIQSIHEKAILHVRNFHKSEKELLDILQEVDEHKVYLAYGVSSLFRYCVELLNLSEGEAYRFIQVARKSVQVPELKTAVNEGLFSVSKASRIAPVITPLNQRHWIEKAKLLTNRKLEREVVSGNPELEIKEKIKPISESKSELRLVISQELENKIQRAKSIFSGNTTEEILDKALNLLLAKYDPIEKAQRNFHKPTLGGVGKKVFTPNTRKPIPASIQHQVHLRDQRQCQFQSYSGKICHEKFWVQTHHVRPVSQGGSNQLDNLITLCSRHHRYLHGD